MATANNLGTAYIKIAPQTEGIRSTIQNAMSRAGSDGGESFNKSFSIKAGAIAGIVSSITSKAITAVTNQFDAAVSRVDTLNVFPKVMKNLGYETDESTESLNRLSTRIEGLPTTLDEIVTYTQRLASSMNSLAKGEVNATDLALAFNDAALSGGKGQVEANRAFEQFVQIIGRGRPMMQDWKIMLEVMPGQLKQMAKYMYSNNKSLQDYAKAAGKTADTLDGMDLYEWISEEKNAYAKERLADFTEAMIKLDKEGGAGIVSFQDQVKDSTQTIGTALRLIPVRITKALANVISAFGAGDIYTVIDKFTKKFKDIGDWVVKYVVPPIKQYVIPAIANVLRAVKNFIEYLASPEGAGARAIVLSIVAAFVTLKTVLPIIASVKAALIALTSTIGVVGVAIAATVAAVQLAKAAIDDISLKFEKQNHLREYSAKLIVNEENALSQLNKARENEASILEDLETKKRLQNDAEYQELQAKQRLADAQQALNDIRKDSSATADQIRMKELELKAAEDAYNDAIENHKKAVEETNKVDKQRYDNMMTGINTQNRLLAAQILEDKQYGTLAKRLDELKTKTIEYQNAQGETVKLSKQEMADLADWYAESLGANDATWKQIVQYAEQNQISFVEACERAGWEGGEKFNLQFAAGVDNYTPFATKASEASIEEVAKSVQDALDNKKPFWRQAIDRMEVIGGLFSSGLASGMKKNEGAVKSTALSIVGSTIKAFTDGWAVHSPSRVAFQIGKFFDEGLVQGLDSLSDRIEEKAQGIADSVLDPFNEDTQLSMNASATSPYTRPLTTGAQNIASSPLSQVIQNNTFNQVADDLDVKEASKLLGFEVATAI